MTLANKLLLGRLLTRSGDQAWDFAVPLVLLIILPGQLKLASLYYLLVRLAHVFLLPTLASWLDRTSRPRATFFGNALQLVGVIGGTVAIFWLYEEHLSIAGFALLTIAGLASGLGSSLMDIAIANDLVPSSFEDHELPKFNSRLHQTDLMTEVTVPILTGLLISLEHTKIPLFGFLLVALWNVISFVPEYLLLSSVFKEKPNLRQKKIEVSTSSKLSLSTKFISGWNSFFRQPVALATLAYAFLWLSVLSPHGFLLTAFLKDGWQTPEWIVGIFRSLGAVFGLIATILYPKVIQKFGLSQGSWLFLFSQFSCAVLALLCFWNAGPVAQIGFLGFILLSRVGLYGFSLGEMQLRQTMVPAGVRGEVNGFASALNGIATLGLYGAGSLLPSTQDFGILVVISATSVGFGLLLFTLWRSRQGT